MSSTLCFWYNDCIYRALPQRERNSESAETSKECVSGISSHPPPDKTSDGPWPTPKKGALVTQAQLVDGNGCPLWSYQQSWI